MACPSNFSTAAALASHSRLPLEPEADGKSPRKSSEEAGPPTIVADVLLGAHAFNALITLVLEVGRLMRRIPHIVRRRWEVVHLVTGGFVSDYLAMTPDKSGSSCGGRHDAAAMTCTTAELRHDPSNGCVV